MSTPRYDLLISGGRVIDPARGLDAPGTVAVRDGRVVATEGEVDPSQAARVIDARGALVCPGFIDVHVHVYEWVTNFGVLADDAGVHAGITTVIDQGSTGAWTFGGFKAHVIDKSRTDVRASVSINLAGALKGGMAGDILHNPDIASVEEVVKLKAQHPRDVVSIKCHAESGSFSRWETSVLAMAAQAGRETGMPLYVHTGELFPVLEDRRPAPQAVLPGFLPHLKPGDMLAHIYSCMPDGIMSTHADVPAVVFEAHKRGIHFDIGHGINFSFAIARKMMDKGVFPYTVGSDAHGDFNAFHDDSKLDYSMLGAVNKLLALGMPLVDVIGCATWNAARWMGADHEIGALRPGMRADLTLLDRVPGDWVLTDAMQERLTVKERLVPRLVVRAGEVIEPHRRYLRDVCSATPRQAAQAAGSRQ
jgi:dihydroorotase